MREGGESSGTGRGGRHGRPARRGDGSRRRLNRAHADLVALAVRLVEDQLWAGGGIRSPQHWLILRAGLSPAHARDVVRLARRRQQVAPAIDLLGRGQLSLDQASEVARRVPATHAVSVTEFARDATVPQLRRVLARYPFDPDPDPEADRDDRVDGEDAEPAPGAGPDADRGDGAAEPAPAEPGAPGAPRRVFAGPPELIVRDRAPASLSMGFDGGPVPAGLRRPGRYGGAGVEAAVREAKDALFTAGGTGATLGDAVGEVAHRSLATVSSASRRDHYRVLVHLDADGAWVNARGTLPRRT